MRKRISILTVELHRSFLNIIFFSGKTLGDISFKLETKIMFFFEKNIIKATQVLSIICNTICLQFSLYRAPFNSNEFTSFSCRIRQRFCASTIRFEHVFFNQQTI
jgi:hypothetical protein